MKTWKTHKQKFEFTSELPIESSAWSGHYFFAYDLVANIKPNLIVELGTHKGNSLFSFAQAVKDLNLGTELHAIDTWEGDKQAGYYGEEIYNKFLKIKDKYYKNVSIIPQKMLFDEAIEKFDDNSIDILHIDGLHTYEAVKHDFETWLPKVKKGTGIILFHDVCEKSDDFGVYKLWDELQKKYETVTFEHYHGLGVLFLGDKIFNKIKIFTDIWASYYLLLSKYNDQRKNVSDKKIHIRNITQNNLLLLKDHKTLQKKYSLLYDEKETLRCKAIEYENFQRTKIWKTLIVYRKLKKQMKNYFSKTLEIIKRLFSYFIAIPRLLTEFPLKEFPLRIYVALRFVKYNEHNRDYQIYLRQNKLDKKYYAKALKEISSFKEQPLISIIMPVYNVDLKWVKKAVNSVREQIYTNWELCIADDASTSRALKKYLEKINKEPQIKVVFRKKNGHISEASNTAINIARGKFVVLIDNDDVMHPQSLYKIAKVINENPSVGLIYSDEDKMELNGTRCDPIFKSDYSPDYLLSTNYFCHLTSVRKDLVDKVGGFRKGYEGSQDYDLFLRVVELIDEKDVIHIPDVLYSWRKIPGSTALTYDQKGYAQIASFKALQDTIGRRKLNAVISEGLQGGFFRVKYNIKGNPLISVIITTKDDNKNLKKCIQTILEKTYYENYEILLISSDENAKRVVENDKISFYHFDKEYNISEMRNFGVQKSDGEYVVILDERTKILDSNWLEGLLEYAQRENTGAVGPKILSKNNEVLCTSFWFDENKNLINVHRSLPPHMQVRANLVANYTIISDICFMISKEKYEKVGGFEDLRDRETSLVDFFLKTSKENLCHVYTPYIEISYSGTKIFNENRIKIYKNELERRLDNLDKHFF